MNNGQTGQNLDVASAPTPNLSEIHANQSIAPLNNTPDNPANWTPERDNKSIGNKVIFSSETPRLDSPIEQAGNSENLGEIVDLNPAVLQPNQPAQPDASSVFAINEDLIRVKDGRLLKGAMGEMKKAEAELGQTGDICNFYDKAREAMEKNLENSYNRKLAA